MPTGPTVFLTYLLLPLLFVLELELCEPLSPFPESFWALEREDDALLFLSSFDSDLLLVLPCVVAMIKTFSNN